MVYRAGSWLFYDFATGQPVPGSSRWTGGGSGCTPAPMDYDGDGKTEFSQLCGGAWHFYNDNGSYLKGIWVGNVAGSIPVPSNSLIRPILIFFASATRARR